MKAARSIAMILLLGSFFGLIAEQSYPIGQIQQATDDVQNLFKNVSPGTYGPFKCTRYSQRRNDGRTYWYYACESILSGTTPDEVLASMLGTAKAGLSRTYRWGSDSQGNRRWILGHCDEKLSATIELFVQMTEQGNIFTRMATETFELNIR